MLTVIVGFEGSGKSRMRRPFACSRYSVMPSTDVTRSTPCGSATAACCAAYAGRSEMNRTTVRPVNQARFIGTSEFGYYKREMVIQGFKSSAVSAGIKPGGVPDLALIYSERPASAAVGFTQNTFIP